MVFKYVIIFLVFLGLTFVVINNGENEQKKSKDFTGSAALKSEITNNSEKSFVVKDDDFSNQDTELKETESELKDMVQGYEHINSDPEQRKVHRDAMADKLSIYNEQVLPVALEKMKERELNESD